MARRVIKGPEEPTPATAAAAAEARVIRRELAKRQRLPVALRGLEASLFPAQSRFVMSTASRIVTWSGRRSGKSYGCSVRALRAAAKYPGSWIPVIERTTTCQSAQVMWRELQSISERYQLGMKFHHTLLIGSLPNRTKVQIVGAETNEAADKIRGEHPPEAIVDEAGTFRDHVLEYLLRDVLEPALMDHRGTLVISGTPKPRKSGPFAQACGVLGGGSTGWEPHHWTFMDNDAIPLDMAAATPEERHQARSEWFESLLQRYGWTLDSPWVQREFLGNWVEDTGGLIYRLAPFNHVGVQAPDLTKGGWRFGLGLDFGYDDATAFVVVAWRHGDPTLWVLESYAQSGLIPSAIAAHVAKLQARYRFDFIVGDMGGYGKGPAEEMRQQYGIPIVAAKKRGKEAHVAFVNGDLASNVVRIVEAGNQDLISDLYGLRRAEGSEWAEDARDANHLPDAFLYAATHQRQEVRGFGDRDPAEVGSLEWHQAREAELEAKLVERDTAAEGEEGDPLAHAVDNLPAW